ncbi:MAG: hypothetical protein WC806_03475 [Candidatus Gracilibacteria bacterium]|jgi:hypothetical protein
MSIKGFDIIEDFKVSDPSEAIDRFMNSQHAYRLMYFLKSLGVDSESCKNLLLEQCGNKIEAILKCNDEVALLREAADEIDRLSHQNYFDRFIYCELLEQDRKIETRGVRAFVIDRLLFSTIYSLYEKEIQRCCEEFKYKKKFPVFERHSPRVNVALAEFVRLPSVRRRIEQILMDVEEGKGDGGDSMRSRIEAAAMQCVLRAQKFLPKKASPDSDLDPSLN